MATKRQQQGAQDDAHRRFVREVVRVAIERAGSQTQLAQDVKCSQASISQWLSGRKQPAAKYLVAMLVYLDYPLDPTEPHDERAA